MKKINIFVVSTGIYNTYINALIKSIDNFKKYWNGDIKTILISDVNNQNFDINYHIPQLPYSLILLGRIHYIKDILNMYSIDENEIMMCLDVDSVFRKMPQNFYFVLENYINTNKMCFARSPHIYNHVVENENTFHISELHMYNNLDKYVQTSLFFGKISAFNKFYIQYVKLEKTYMYSGNSNSKHKIPIMHDQTIINKIILDNINDYIIDDFIFNGYQFDFINTDDYLTNDFTDKDYACANETYHLNNYNNIFIIQKFNNDIKQPIRLSM